MLRKTLVPVMALALAFTLTAYASDGNWVLTTTKKGSGTFTSYGSGTNKNWNYYPTGSCDAYAQGYDFSYHNTSTSISSSTNNWIRKRYDWEGTGTPTTVTKNVNILVKSRAECTVRAFTGIFTTSNVSGYAYATGYASQSGGGGSPALNKDGHAQISLSASHGSVLSNWTLSVSAKVPSFSTSQSGSGSYKTYAKGGNTSLGGGYQFSQNGAQIYASTTASASGSQTNGEDGNGDAQSTVNHFTFN